MIQVIITDDKKEKDMSFEANMDMHGSDCMYNFDLCITGYGRDKEGAMESFKEAVKTLLGEISCCDFKEAIGGGE